MIKQNRLLKTFLELVKIDSPSFEEKDFREFLTKKLLELGAESAETDGYGNLIAKFDGVGEPFMLNAHMDTVEPGKGIGPIVEEDIIKTDGSTVLGGDPKSGVVAILEALESVKEEGTPHLPLDVVFTVQEEQGLLGAINLDYNKIRAKSGLTFDGGEEVHKVNISAPGYNKVDIKIVGRGAHAGAEPEKGLSAVKIVAGLIELLNLGRIDEETTANIGLIEGGSARNAVPEHVLLKGEIRSRDIEKLEKHTKHFKESIEEILKRYPEAKIEVDIHREFDPYRFSENHPTIQKVRKAFEDIGLTPILVNSGGGTDVNIFHTHGIEAIVVGDGDYNAHTTREYVIIPQMVEAAKFCEKVISI